LRGILFLLLFHKGIEATRHKASALLPISGRVFADAIIDGFDREDNVAQKKGKNQDYLLIG
jgi:hypothetical protein